MPELIIAVLRHNGEAPPKEARARFGPDGGTIGRGSGSTLVLADPERLISRSHALIEFREGRFVVRDQGSALPLSLNGRALGNGHFAAIGKGDELAIGRYVLRVEAEEGVDTAASDETVVRPAPARPETAANVPDLSMNGTLLSWSEDGAPVPADAIRTVFVPSPAGSTPPGPARTPSEAVPANATADLDAAGVVETMPTAAEPTAPAEPPPAPPHGALLEALLAGAGVPRLSIPGGLTPELMHAVGEMLRETVQGLLDLLVARALTKRELRADATMIVAQDNNPLKFSPSVEAAIAHLLAPRGKGFMPPLRAIADAHQSLRSHQLAFMAGMQAGLASVFKRLDPKALEQRSGQPSLMGSFMPSTHKAHLWDQYVALHAEVARDAESDFQSLFGREFLHAYQSQVNRLKQAPAESPG